MVRNSGGLQRVFSPPVGEPVLAPKMETLGAQAGIMMRCALEDSAKSLGARCFFADFFLGGKLNELET